MLITVFYINPNSNFIYSPRVPLGMVSFRFYNPYLTQIPLE